MKNLIDFEFCRLNHGFTSDEEVQTWFSQSKPGDFRTFSPSFAPLEYLFENEDVRSAGVHPVHHYLQYGFDEPRDIKPVRKLRDYAVAELARGVSPYSDARVAIVLHIYYPSFIPYFVERLTAIGSLTWDVFISAPADVVLSHEIDLRQAFGGRLRALRAVPNRGRNFAPMFIDFAAELSGYDAICHCHSKESLYSGRRQTEWADYLISGLLGAPDVMQRHLNLLLSGSCEVISPAPFVGMPPWASHSLSNDVQFSQLCGRLGLDQSTGFMTYPIGGMFWMSRAVFTAVGSLALTYDDFPPEPSRPDGELHHALERLIGRIADRNLAFFDQVTGHYWAADAVLRSEVRRSTNADDLCATIDIHDVVSFDFFDTLCTRSTGDEEWAKRRVEFVLGQNYMAHRNAVETRLRSDLGVVEDVPLSLIAQALAGDGFIDAPRALALERLFDLATLLPRPQIVHAYEYAVASKKKVMIVSDSFYDQGLIRSFLLDHGVSEPDEIIVSSEVGMRKDRGDLWRHLAGLNGALRKLHIGDNVHSDIQNASVQGFSTFYVQHWRHELLPFAGFSKKLLKRSFANPGFSRSTDRAAPEIPDDDLQERYLDAAPERIPKRRRVSAHRSAG